MMKQELDKISLTVVTGGDNGDAAKDNNPNMPKFRVKEVVMFYISDVHWLRQVGHIEETIWGPGYWVYKIKCNGSFPHSGIIVRTADDISNTIN